MFTQAFAQRIRIADLDEYSVQAEALRWSLRADQLPGGTFSADLDFLHTSRLQLAIVNYSGAFAAVGRAPERTITFALPLDESAPTVFNRRILAENALLAIPPGQQISFRMTGRVSAATIAVDEALVDRYAQALFGHGFARLAQRGDGIASSAAGARTAVARMRAFLSLYGSAGGDRRQAPVRNGPWEHLEALLLDDVLGDFVPPEPEAGWSRRSRIVRDAEEFIREHADRPVSIAELCMTLKVPARTLNAAFRDCTGAPPKRFMLAIRLNAARRQLTRPTGVATVTAVAAEHGFYHFGRFSAEYQSLFGELPSETLRRSAGR